MCAMKDLSAMLPYVLFVAVMLAWPTTSAATLRADLTHVDSGRGFTKRELISRMVARSTARAASLGASAQAATAPVYPGKGEYLIPLGIGTPSPQAVVLALDTGSDLIWTQCACIACYKQAVPVFKPSASSTLGVVSCTDPICSEQGGLPLTACSVKEKQCRYGYSYGDRSFTIGTIIEDTFTFNGSAVPSLRFGCGMNNSGLFTSDMSGIAGFGRGPLSLPSQLNVSVFSHCFRTIGVAGSSPVFLGMPDNLGTNVLSTPFAPTPNGGISSLYYLSLQGVTVGQTLLPFNASVFALQQGGTIIDSGTSITRFPPVIFQGLQEAFVSQVNLPVVNASDTSGLLCFSTSQDPKKVAMPKLVLHLEGADWDIPRENYVLDVEDDSGTGGAVCVVILSAGDLNMTIIGNFQQQNTHIVYDLEANKLVFTPARCGQL